MVTGDRGGKNRGQRSRETVKPSVLQGAVSSGAWGVGGGNDWELGGSDGVREGCCGSMDQGRAWSGCRVTTAQWLGPAYHCLIGGGQ
jgi:hypothetical protein